MPYLDKVSGGPNAFATSWFQKVRDRIEEIKPIEGKYIKIKNTTEGQVISFKGNYVEIDICAPPGTPEKIRVFVV